MRRLSSFVCSVPDWAAKGPNVNPCRFLVNTSGVRGTRRVVFCEKVESTGTSSMSGCQLEACSLGNGRSFTNPVAPELSRAVLSTAPQRSGSAEQQCDAAGSLVDDKSGNRIHWR